ncbi:MAG: Holliday junction helicase RuvB [Pseudomonadota bacterium]|jgi:Holliday junction DNA helicase RuvB
MFDRVVEGHPLENEKLWETKLRPLSFEDFPGQEQVKDKLKVFVAAAKKRGEALDHTLLCGPPGLGKTTLARIIAEEMGVDFRSTSAPAIEKKGDLAALLTSLKPQSVLFIDEIHRLSRVLEEYLYTAMEDFFIDIMTGEGLGARSMKFELAPFTLIGATTRAGLLHGPFIDRFGIMERLQFYDRASLEKIVARSAGILNVHVDGHGVREVARRSRGTPRIANRLLRRVRDYAEIHGQGVVDEPIAEFALNQLGVDKHGLDEMDRQILSLIHSKFAGGPVGVETLAAALSEERDTLEEVYEPFLLQEGFIMKTPRGRITTELAKMHLESEDSP